MCIIMKVAGERIEGDYGISSTLSLLLVDTGHQSSSHFHNQLIVLFSSVLVPAASNGDSTKREDEKAEGG